MRLHYYSIHTGGHDPLGAAKVIALTTGTPQLVVKLMYGSGLHISEAIRLYFKMNIWYQPSWMGHLTQILETVFGKYCNREKKTL